MSDIPWATGFSDLFLMSYPRPDWALKGRANFLSQAGSGARKSGPRQAMEDWLAIARAIEQAGGRVVVMPPAPPLELTGLPYTAEAGHSFRDGDGRPAFLLPRMTPEHRRAEPTYTAGFVAALGWRAYAPRARWEGQGDALRVDAERIVHTYGEGPMARTEGGAYEEVASRLSPRHVRIRYRADPWFHGNTFLGIYRRAGTGEPLAVLCPDALEPEELARLLEFLKDVPVVRIDAAASRGYATNALQVNRTVIAPSGLDERLYGVWRDLGLTVVTLGMDALFRSGGGAAVCLTNRLDGIRPEDIPAHLFFSSQREALERLGAGYPEEAPR